MAHTHYRDAAPHRDPAPHREADAAEAPDSSTGRAAVTLRDRARRLPLVAVDSVESVDGGFIGRKKVVTDDPYLAGHFPSLTVYPGVFLIESLQQMLELHTDGALGGIELVEISSVRFSRPALADDELLFETAVSGDRTRLLTKTTCSIGGQRCARITATWRCRP